MGDRPVCPRCGLTIERGEEYHPTIAPSHVRCREHNQCHVLCIDAPEHAEYRAWYEKRFGRKPAQREVTG